MTFLAAVIQEAVEFVTPESPQLLKLLSTIAKSFNIGLLILLIVFGNKLKQLINPIILINKINININILINQISVSLNI